MRRIVVSLISLLAVACAGYTGYWFYIAGKLKSSLAPWAEARRAEGFVVAWDAATVEGFPRSFRLKFTRAAYGSERPVPYTINSDLILAEAAPWDLQRWQVSAPHGATLRSPIEEDGASAATIDGTIGLGGTPGTVVDLAAHDLIGTTEIGKIRAADAAMRLTLPDRPPASHRDTAFDLTLRLTGLTLPLRGAPFGDTIKALTLTGSFKGALPSGPLRQALAAWRDDGGTIELQQSALRWGSLAVDANGTLALDAELQPIGAFTAVILDHGALIDAIVAAGEMREGDAGLVKTFLGLMAKSGPDGQKRLTLPLRVQNDRVFLGPVEVAVLPRVTW